MLWKGVVVQVFQTNVLKMANVLLAIVAVGLKG
jgi:hypothetical protein